MHPVENKAWFLLDLCPWILSWFAWYLLFFFCLCSHLQESSVAASCPGRESVSSPAQSCFSAGWLGIMCGCVCWWIDQRMWRVTVEFCLPFSCGDSSYGLTPFPNFFREHTGTQLVFVNSLINIDQKSWEKNAQI